MPPRSRVSAKLRSTSSALSLNASLATPERSRARLLYTARRAAPSPRQRWTPAAFFSAMRLFQAPSSRSFRPSREWYPLSATSSAGSSGVGVAPTAARLASAAPSVPGRVAVSPRSAAWTSAATIAPVSRSTACSGFVGQAGAAVLQLGDPGLGIGRRGPLRVRQPLALALAVQPDQVLRPRRRDPAPLPQPLQHLPVALAAVAPHDRPQGGVGLHGRGVGPDPLALDQPVLGQPPQHPGEDRLVHP